MTHIPFKFVRSSAGFSPRGGDYFLGRANVVPPPELQLKVFEWANKWTLRFANRAKGKLWKEGGLDSQDLAGENFIKLIVHLRVIFLQDMALIQPGM